MRISFRAGSISRNIIGPKYHKNSHPVNSVSTKCQETFVKNENGWRKVDNGISDISRFSLTKKQNTFKTFRVFYAL